MSEGHRDYHVNGAAAQELESQAQRSREVLERLAATEPQRDRVDRDLVERRHVLAAAEILFGLAIEAHAHPLGPPRCVFISYSHDDDHFVRELCGRLNRANIAHFKADRDIRPAADWAESIWQAIRDCRVVLSIVTPRFLQSRWRDLEGGAAIASGKQVLVALRYVQRADIAPPFDRFQSMVVETESQIVELVATLKSMCPETA